MPLLDDRAFSLTAQGYAARNCPGMDDVRRELLHRVLLKLDPGDPRQVDHINRDRLDCRRANLRIVLPSGQVQNRPRPGGRKRGRSRFRNVIYHAGPGRRKRWQAVGTVNRRTHSLGYFASEEEAGAVAAAWRRQHHAFATD